MAPPGVAPDLIEQPLVLARQSSIIKKKNHGQSQPDFLPLSMDDSDWWGTVFILLPSPSIPAPGECLAT
jgi:hypothetical protein